MGGRWKEARLNELYEYRSGLSKPRSAFGSGFGFLSFKDVFYNIFVPQILTELVNSTEQERDSCSIRRGDVFLTRTSETMDELGMSCVALRDYESATFNGFCKRLRPKPDTKISPEYAAYYFRSSQFRRAVTAMSSLSTRASLNNNMLDRLTMVLPPYRLQAAIGSILKTLDDKIELNRRTNETLEAIARAIFKSWFVDFDPVRAKAQGSTPSGMDAATAALFPSEFQDSELGKIPKGWRVGVLSDLALLNPEAWKGANAPPVITYVDLSNTKWGTIESVYRYSWSEAPSRARRILRPDDTVVGTVRPGNGSYALVSSEGLTGSTGFAVLRPHKSRQVAFVYLAATARQNIESLAHLADGGAYPAIRPDVVASTSVVIPSDDILSIFETFVRPTHHRIAFNNRQSRTLASFRDTLLPRLLSGELSVNRANRVVEAKV